MKLYADYIKEKHGKQIILIENEGFATYTIDISPTTGTKYIYIYDMYVAPEYRGSSTSVRIVDEIHRVAREAGCSFSLSTIVMSEPGADRAVRFQVGCGALPIGMENGILTLKKML
jgi:GNAT superfamily N-acetyltransferase